MLLSVLRVVIECVGLVAWIYDWLLLYRNETVKQRIHRRKMTGYVSVVSRNSQVSLVRLVSSQS